MKEVKGKRVEEWYFWIYGRSGLIRYTIILTTCLVVVALIFLVAALVNCTPDDITRYNFVSYDMQMMVSFNPFQLVSYTNRISPLYDVFKSFFFICAGAAALTFLAVCFLCRGIHLRISCILGGEIVLIDGGGRELTPQEVFSGGTCREAMEFMFSERWGSDAATCEIVIDYLLGSLGSTRHTLLRSLAVFSAFGSVKVSHGGLERIRGISKQGL